MMSVPWQWGQCRTCRIMLSLGWLGGCSASHTPRENSRPTPLKHPPFGERLRGSDASPFRSGSSMSSSIDDRTFCHPLLTCLLRPALCLLSLTLATRGPPDTEPTCRPAARSRRVQYPAGRVYYDCPGSTAPL